MRKIAKTVIAASVLASVVISALSKWDAVIATVGKPAMLGFLFVLGVCTLFVLFTQLNQS